MTTEKRDQFTSNTGFVLASVGAAIGLGNIWMFPWRLGQFGGAAFLIPYLVFVYLLARTGLMGEYGLGRWANRGPVGALDKIYREKGMKIGGYLGAYPVVVTWGVFLFYAVVAGWILRYLFLAWGGTFLQEQDTAAYFGAFAGSKASVYWMIVNIALTSVILLFGISRGIERVNRILMPVLLVLLLILLVRSLTLPGAIRGIEYLLHPDWKVLLDPLTWGMALGQAFFTVSLAGSGMVVYGSYLKPDADIPKAAFQTVTFDTLAAFLAALVIMPAVFAYDLDPAAGPPLLFITLPELFGSMPQGQIFGGIFFLGVFFAAISSLVSMKEVADEALMDRMGWSRRFTVITVALVSIVACLPLALDMAFFTATVDFITIYLVPLGALIAAISFFWVLGIKRARAEINKGSDHPMGVWWELVAKYLFVGVALIIVVLQILYQVG